MNNKKIIYMCIAIVIAVFLLYRYLGNASRNEKVITQPQKENTLAMQTNSEGSVDITVAPKVLTKGKTIQFDITLTTHEGSLDFDLAKISKLVDDKGTVYDPISWSGGKGGHHLNGALLFSPLSDKVKRVTLTLSGIENIDRVFSWDLK